MPPVYKVVLGALSLPTDPPDCPTTLAVLPPDRCRWVRGNTGVPAPDTSGQVVWSCPTSASWARVCPLQPSLATVSSSKKDQPPEVAIFPDTGST